jgi:hypothetical protein
MWPAAASASPARVCLSSNLYCTAFGRVWSTTACAVSWRICLQQPVLPLDVSVLQYSVHPWPYLSTTAGATPGRVCLQKHVLHLECLSTKACAAPGMYVYSSLCCPLKYMSTAACAALGVVWSSAACAEPVLPGLDLQ